MYRKVPRLRSPDKFSRKSHPPTPGYPGRANFSHIFLQNLLCPTAVLGVVTQRSSPALRYDTENDCAHGAADYTKPGGPFTRETESWPG